MSVVEIQEELENLESDLEEAEASGESQAVLKDLRERIEELETDLELAQDEDSSP